jgi:hypothetical protein
VGTKLGKIQENRVFMVWKKLAYDTQPPEKLYPPISFYEAHLKHIWSTFRAFLKQKNINQTFSQAIIPLMKHLWSTSGAHSSIFEALKI